MPKISKERRNLLERVKKAIEGAKINDCKHKKLAIGVFMHGGGFSPSFGSAELICLDCSLNITLFPGIKPEEYGLKVSESFLGELNSWAKKEFKNQDYKERKTVLSANEITKDPVAAYNNTIKWDQKIPIEFLDLEKAASHTGT